MKCYHVGSNFIMWDQCYRLGVECYHVGVECYHVGSMLSCGDQCYYVRVRCYYVGSMLSCGGQMLSCGINVIMWYQSYHVGSNVIIWDELLSCGMECGIKCYHVLLSCDVIMGHDNTPQFYFS
jgi:hypothetical protein